MNGKSHRTTCKSGCKVVVFGAMGNLGAYIAVSLEEQVYDVIAVGYRKSDSDFLKRCVMLCRMLMDRTNKILPMEICSTLGYKGRL